MQQIQWIEPAEFLERATGLPVIDVRSPSEYRQGHVPGAYNIPLFDDSERAIVGTTYTNAGSRQAVLKGLEIAGPKLAGMVLQAQKICTAGEALLHCWRGGMRSEAMAWLLNFACIRATALKGGYKAYRRHVRDSMGKGPSMLILAGMTGSGKTQVLCEMASQGCQVIDLEGLAHHKGSAFGALGQDSQPTTEQFENDLARQWMKMDPGLPVWLEDESLNIGRVVIPEPFFRRMTASKVVLLEVEFPLRVERLVAEYGNFPPAELAPDIRKISKRMGGASANRALDALMSGDLRLAVSEVLTYYDKAYGFSLRQRSDQVIRIIKVPGEIGHGDLPGLLRTIR